MLAVADLGGWRVGVGGFGWGGIDEALIAISAASANRNIVPTISTLMDGSSSPALYQSYCLFNKMSKDKHFHYHKGIDRLIVKAVSSAMKVEVKKAVKIKHGEVNHVYKIITSRGNLLARVFKNKNWPAKESLPWIEKQLAKHKIPHAKILYYSRSSKFFPFGFMVTEFIQGPNGNEAVKLGRISFSQAFEKTGKMLRKVHAIKARKFGSINNKQDQYSDFIKFKLLRARNNLKRLESHNLIQRGLYKVVEKQIKETFLPFQKSFFPVLNHADANRENAILSPDGQWVFVDWDNAYFGIWLEDYTELTYWVDWKRKPIHAKRIHALINKNFFKGYGGHQFSQTQIADLEKTLHLIKATNMMIYHWFSKKDQADFKKSKSKFLKLLE